MRVQPSPDPHNVRNYLTDRDSAFIYACRKFNIKQEQFFFTKEAIEKYYTGKDNKYSLIKVNFDLHTTYNHLYIFVFLMLKELNLSTYLYFEEFKVLGIQPTKDKRLLKRHIEKW